MKTRTPFQLAMDLGRWQDSIAMAEAKIPCDANALIDPAVVAELRQIRDRLRAIRQAQDRRWLEAAAADDQNPARQKWAREALAAKPQAVG